MSPPNSVPKRFSTSVRSQIEDEYNLKQSKKDLVWPRTLDRIISTAVNSLRHTIFLKLEK